MRDLIILGAEVHAREMAEHPDAFLVPCNEFPGSAAIPAGRLASLVDPSSGVRLAGHVRVEDSCYLGQGCNVRQHLRIGARSLIGMGSVVITHVPLGSVMAGNPARRLRQRVGDER